MRRLMLLLTLLVCLAESGYSQIQIVASSRITSTTTAGNVINEIGTGVNLHKITWNVSGTVSSCSVKLEKAATSTGPWTDLISGASCTSNGGPSTLTSGVTNFVRVNATTFSGTGSLTVNYRGYTDRVANGTASGTAGQVAFFDGTTSITSDSDMTFTTDTLTATKIVGSTSITDTGLTATRVTFAGTGGLLSDDAGMTYVAASDALTIVGSLSMNGGIITGSSSGLWTNVPFIVPQGTEAAPSIVSSSYPTSGFWWDPAPQLNISISGTKAFTFNTNTIKAITATGAIGFGVSQDLILQRTNAGVLKYNRAAATAAATDYRQFWIANSGVATTAAAFTTPTASSLYIDEPNLAVGGSGGALTLASTLIINGAPTEGGVNYAEYIASGTVRWAGYGDGTATFSGGTGTITSVSDVRLKDVQGSYTAGLKEILLIDPILYKWNMDAEHLKGITHSDRVYAGFSAQNVDAALPEYGTGRDEEGYMTLQDRAILGAVVNSLKELNTRLEAVERR